MSSNDKPNVNELNEEITLAKNELELNRQSSISSNLEQQDKFIELLFDKGGEIFTKYNEIVSENEKFLIEKNNIYQLEELKVVNMLVRRDKIFKGILIIVCIFLLCLLAYYEKAQSIAPVIGVIIGLLFKSNSLSDYFSSNKKKNISENES